MTKEEFINECAFAKEVLTLNGSALLVAGMVIEVSGPHYLEGGSPNFKIEWLAEALRQGRRPMNQGAQGQNVGSLFNQHLSSLNALAGS